MPELAPSGEISLSPSHYKAASDIGNLALQVVVENYGTGYPDFLPGAHNLYFHGGHHTATVAKSSNRLAHYMGLPRPARAVTFLAGRAHDVVQLQARGVMEANSAEWLSGQQIGKKGFYKAAIIAAQLAILGTEPIMDEYNLAISQKAIELGYPPKKAEAVSFCVASGDFADLCSPIGPY